ncbi:Bidirectional sugar transporter SWEET15, partial [Bienertia sinuspersici]
LTFYRIYKKKSTEEFQSIPYVVAFFSCIIWLLYAFVKTDVMFLVTINSFSVFIEIIYLAFFLIYANRKTRITIVKHLLLFNVFRLGVIFFFTMVIAKTTRVRLLILINLSRFLILCLRCSLGRHVKYFIIY